VHADSFSFLKELMLQSSPSGFEVPAQKVIRARMKKFADRVETDVHGNVMGVLNPGAKRKIMLAGHVDEIGLLITHIDAQGYAFFGTIGGWDSVIAIGQHVTVITKKGEVPGVIGRKPVHLLEQNERGKEVKIEDMWIDIGAKDKKSAEKIISVGDPVVVKPNFVKLQNDLVASRAFDDRCGAWVVVETLRKLAGRKLKVAVYAVSTVQEEVGLRGATTSAYNIKPDAGIAVDVGLTSDYPGSNPKKTGDISINKGPILHSGPNINPVLGKMLCNVAGRNKIKVQMQAEPRATGTDANPIQIVRGGCAAALVSIPNRYTHSPVEVISLRDLEACVDLLAATIEEMTGTESFIPE
jgi:endoglucanase